MKGGDQNKQKIETQETDKVGSFSKILGGEMAIILKTQGKYCVYE